jgi:hypothetical protein
VRAQCLVKKRQLCRFYARNACTKGVFCIWAHGEAELELAPPPTGPCARKTRLCSHYVEGWCAQGKLCPFAHGSEELRKDPKDKSPQRPQQTGAWLGRRPDLDAAVMMVANPEKTLADVIPGVTKLAALPAPEQGRRSVSKARKRRSSSASSTRLDPAGGAGGEGAADPGGTRLLSVLVTGCSDPQTASGVHGEYEICGANHDRPAFKSIDYGQGFESFIYFWDDRDGPAFTGWWIGPSLGGQDAWVRHPGVPSERWPPRSGWLVPHDGPVDSHMVVELALLSSAPSGPPAPGKAPGAAPAKAVAKADAPARPRTRSPSRSAAPRRSLADQTALAKSSVLPRPPQQAAARERPRTRSPSRSAPPCRSLASETALAKSSVLAPPPQKAAAKDRPRTRSPSRSAPPRRSLASETALAKSSLLTRPPQQAAAKADVVCKVSQPKLEAGKEARRVEDDANVKVEDDSKSKEELDALENSLEAVHKESDEQMKRMMELQRSMDELRKSMEERRDREDKIQHKMRSLGKTVEA